jgi:AraC-like DNA-binding protein
MRHAPPMSAHYAERPGTHRAVAAVWMSSTAQTSSALVAADGCFDLIVRANDRDISAFIYRPVPHAHHALAEAGDRFIGVRLQPGWGAALLAHADLLETVERRAIEDASALESLVARAVDAHKKQPDIVGAFIEEARAAAGTLRLTARTSTTHERELQRACQTWLGMTPKAFLRIERIWAARNAIQRGIPLAIVAAEFGYADQAHLTREARHLLGMTPRELGAAGNLQDVSAPRR